MEVLYDTHVYLCLGSALCGCFKLLLHFTVFNHALNPCRVAVWAATIKRNILDFFYFHYNFKLCSVQTSYIEPCNILHNQ